MEKWKGLPKWQCTRCPWSTLQGEAEMLAHIEQRHTPPAPRLRAVTLPLVGPRGEPIRKLILEEQGDDQL
jgi:hypothetical protein